MALLAAACGAVASSGAPVGQAASVAAPLAADWPNLGLDLANTRAVLDETTIGPDNVATLGSLWELTGVNGVSGTPIVIDGVLYVGDWAGQLRALDAATGEEVWSADVGSQIPGTVAVDETRVFAGTWDGRLVARNRETGAAEWEVPVDDHEIAVVYGSPVQVDGLVIVPIASDEWWEGEEFTFRGSVAAFDAETGDEVWRYWTTCGAENAGQDNCPQDPPAEGGGVGLFGAPAVDTERGVVYVGTGNQYEPPTGARSDALIALDLATGEEVWANQFTEGDWWNIPGVADPEVGPDADLTVPNLFQVGTVDAVGIGDKGGTYKAVNRDTGEELWSVKLTAGSIQGGVMSSAAVADGTVYLTSNRGGQAADLVALDTADGTVLWRVDVGGSVVGPVSWANGLVYVADNTGRFSAFDATNGESLWSFDVSRQAAGGMAIVDGIVYGGWGWSLTPDSPEGGLIAFSLDGEPPDGDPGISLGEAVFQQNCALCHGPNGAGGAGPSLWGVGDRHTFEEIRDVVTAGQGAMPAWEGVLTTEEIDAVAEYARTAWSGGYPYGRPVDAELGGSVAIDNVATGFGPAGQVVFPTGSEGVCNPEGTPTTLTGSFSANDGGRSTLTGIEVTGQPGDVVATDNGAICAVVELTAGEGGIETSNGTGTFTLSDVTAELAVTGTGAFEPLIPADCSLTLDIGELNGTIAGDGPPNAAELSASGISVAEAPESCGIYGLLLDVALALPSTNAEMALDLTIDWEGGDGHEHDHDDDHEH